MKKRTGDMHSCTKTFRVTVAPEQQVLSKVLQKKKVTYIGEKIFLWLRFSRINRLNCATVAHLGKKQTLDMHSSTKKFRVAVAQKQQGFSKVL